MNAAFSGEFVSGGGRFYVWTGSGGTFLEEFSKFGRTCRPKRRLTSCIGYLPCARKVLSNLAMVDLRGAHYPEAMIDLLAGSASG
jgi:hypothetical protein